MLTSPHAALAAAAVSLAGAVWIIAAGGSVLLVALLLIAARAFVEPESRGWVTAGAPVWAAAVVVAAWRAGSSDLADIGGAHAVLGAGLLRGEAFAVASLWLVLIAGVAVAGHPRNRAAILVWAVQALFLTALVCAPQVRNAADGLVWLVALAVIAAQLLIVRALGPAARLAVARAAAVGALALGAYA